MLRSSERFNAAPDAQVWGAPAGVGATMSTPEPAGMPDPDEHTGAPSSDDSEAADDAPSTESASDADAGDT